MSLLSCFGICFISFDLHIAIGVDAAILGMSFLKYSATNATLIVDPFCGYGTILATANYFKLNSFGIDLSLKRCKKAISRSLDEEIESVPITRRKMLGARGEEIAVYKPYKTELFGINNMESEDQTEFFGDSKQSTRGFNDGTVGEVSP